MKRIVVLIAILALLTAGTISVFAGPIHVGGEFTVSEATIQHTPQGNAWGYLRNHAGELEMCGPIHVGGE